MLTKTFAGGSEKGRGSGKGVENSGLVCIFVFSSPDGQDTGPYCDT